MPVNDCKRVLFVIPTLGQGGAEKVLVNLVNNLDKNKYDITLVTLFDIGENKKYLFPDIAYRSCFRRPFRGNSILFSLIPSRFLYNWLINDHYDIVVSYLEGPTAHIVSGCPYEDTKIIQWVHIELGDRKHFKVGFRSFNEAVKAYSRAARLVFVAKTVKSVFETTAGKPFPNSMVLYNTNETERILEKSMEPITDVDFSSETINICSVGKLILSKGFDRLVKVHHRLCREGFRIHVYILGEGNQHVELQNYLNQNGLADSFSFLGYRENPYKYVAACDMYVCSSRREGFSTAVTESLIVGTPVVSTDCSGARELLGEDDEYGIVCENSEEGIYQGMKCMLSDNSLRKAYAEKASERGRKFSRTETVAAVEKMLDDLLHH